MVSQHWCRLWLGAVRQQAITWANVDPDLCHHMASLSHNEIKLQHHLYGTLCYIGLWSWSRHQMETFSTLLALCMGNSLVTGEFHSQRPVTQMLSLICAWINTWVNDCKAGVLRCHRTHNDVTVIAMVIVGVLDHTPPWWTYIECHLGKETNLSVTNSLVTGEFHSQRPVTQMLSLICAWINTWVNDCKAGVLRCHRTHNDVTVIAMVIVGVLDHTPPWWTYIECHLGKETNLSVTKNKLP